MSDTSPRLARLRRGGQGLRQRTARGTIVNAIYLLGLNGLGFIKGFIVAAFLTASDYGVWGILLVGIGTLLWLKQVGIGDKYVQQEEEDQELAFQKAFTLELIVTGFFFLLVLAALPLFVLVYGETQLLLPGLVIAFGILAGPLAAPILVFYRDMNFVKQRSLEAVDPLLSFVLTVALAIAGFGYWSLVIGAVAGSWAAALVAIKASPYPLRWRYDRGTMREYVGFSWPVFVSSMSGMVIAQGSVLVGDWELGLAGVGAIALAASISQFADRVDTIIISTLYPAICAVRDRRDLLFESFVKSNRLALMWAVPFGVGLALFAPDLVEFGIGDEWTEAVILIQVFGLTAAANHLGFNWHMFYRALGNTRPMAVVAFITMLSFIAAAVPLLISRGLEGFAIGMGIMTAVTLVARTVYLVKLFDGFQMLRHAARALAPAVPAIAIVLIARALESGERSFGMALAELTVYLGATAAATLVFERELLREVVGYLRRRAPAPQVGAPA